MGDFVDVDFNDLGVYVCLMGLLCSCVVYVVVYVVLKVYVDNILG